ncbi:hypothetical protein [Streptomyces albofaciens]|uniref:hypothetical protein n=1 Tax=Streptomyces albofaciens TaxID=66866 RepID=UPI001AD616EB|nr:hypothetical protein [Streptomyces albofaciens]
MSTEALHRLVVSGDVCGSGRLGLRAKLRMREAMYDVFEAGFAAVGVTEESFHLEDRGDGVLVALDPRVPSAQLVGPWLEGVYQRLRQVNEGRAEPLRLRVAMHAGPVARDEKGLAGRAVDLACRLCDSDTARSVMRLADRAPLLFVVSDSLYRDVVAEGGTCIEPEHYRRARVSEKETEEEAWFHVPRLPSPPLPDETAQEAPPDTAVRAPERPCATGVRAAQGPVPEQGGGAGHGGTVPPPASGPGPAAGTAPAPAPRPAAYATKYHFGHIGGSNQIYDGNTFNGDFTGVRHPDAVATQGETVTARGDTAPQRTAPQQAAVDGTQDAAENGTGPEGGAR